MKVHIDILGARLHHSGILSRQYHRLPTGQCTVRPCGILSVHRMIINIVIYIMCKHRCKLMSIAVILQRVFFCAI